ncbi:MAG TPA: HAD family phosphatase [Jatrophihabitans sp.]|nr:HAD family phosphatase [Jatrophihabitans sp.]
MLQAVLFDLDGTLIDSEPYWIEAEYKLVAEFGGQWSDEHAHALIGSDLLVAGAYIRDVGGVALEPAEIVDRMLEHVIAATRQQVPWLPGARELIADCRSVGLPCALVTMSYASLTAVVLDALPPGTFGAVVTGDQVRHGKPHPEPYLTASRLLGAEPTRTVAIEDSPPGLASAEAAGCRTVAVPNRVPLEPAPTRTVVGSLADLTAASLAALLP